MNLINSITCIILISSVLFDYIFANEWQKHEFKIMVQPGTVEYFYQPVETGSVFHVSYHVIKGDDISVFVLNPHRQILRTFNKEGSGTHQVQNVTDPGDYEICLDNSYSHFTSKIVSVYILTFHTEVLMQKFKEEKELNETAHLAKEVVNKISLNLIEMFSSQALMRFKQTRDDYLIEANNSLVFYWSAFQSVLIIMCGLFQVYFIKRLFNVGKKSYR